MPGIYRYVASSSANPCQDPSKQRTGSDIAGEGGKFKGPRPSSQRFVYKACPQGAPEPFPDLTLVQFTQPLNHPFSSHFSRTFHLAQSPL